VEYTTDLGSKNWHGLGSTFTASDRTVSSSDILGQNGQRFYRVVLLPWPAPPADILGPSNR
jgi:hypothetical protein